MLLCAALIPVAHLFTGEGFLWGLPLYRNPPSRALSLLSHLGFSALSVSSVVNHSFSECRLSSLCE